jgi:hypothetical protein
MATQGLNPLKAHKKSARSISVRGFPDSVRALLASNTIHIVSRRWYGIIDVIKLS